MGKGDDSDRARKKSKRKDGIYSSKHIRKQAEKAANSQRNGCQPRDESKKKSKSKSKSKK